MGSLLDIIYSLSIRATIVIMIVGLTLSLRDVLYEKTSENAIRDGLAQTTKILENDVKKAGYGISSGTPITIAEPQRIKFVSDIDADGYVDTVEYSLARTDPYGSDTTTKSLRRYINSGAGFELSRGTMCMYIQYLDSLNRSTASLSSIESLSINLSQTDTYYSGPGTKCIEKKIRIFLANF